MTRIEPSTSSEKAAAQHGDNGFWDVLRRETRARVGLARTGNAQTTPDVLGFQAAHAQARDAVHTPLDVPALSQALLPAVPVVVTSAAQDRPTYLRRPDLGRQLDDASRDSLKSGKWDLAIVLADGLSARAVSGYGPALFHACLAGMPDLRIAPPVIALQGRVALGDDIAQSLGARMVAVLIGERPGLSVSDSMGVYFTFEPRRGCPDSRRNCLSNIHTHGLSVTEASLKLIWLIRESQRLGLSGVDLKERAPAASATDAARMGSAPHTQINKSREESP
ncbi:MULTISPECIES: ethanolamine ammonia-lyase subunit EutC [Asaia]|uniref:Ethanolamine ammonia-lyase small subunit n=1 Tax=Asaia bogorensis NBRC 16594 TaxID=1231624 RepID=A0AAN4U3E1_9PROT|nr:MULTISPECIES: ethanolamine ammonia-lyase subunit EutC [Asaia]MDL2169617.1 ethanolamine ammonia-lyase subunit EutC [Asaia sp. HumB]BAT19761.1 ethanolamine ammonia lyase small subunit [Asaia bogorensis NBRC 16594]GBQ77792.1 ethanolamine ammonia-lyase small subunit [Asaia bogorensis NBRC 16594]GEL54403.1 ethanolamine ammonia-lyase light chain [Asaia bogorensis NBRC 16594]